MAGVYANFANVSHSDYEFTITFARVDHEVDDDEVPGVVVSRVNLSPRFMRELIDAMQDNYSKWSARERIRELPETENRDEDERRGRGGRRPVGRRGAVLRIVAVGRARGPLAEAAAEYERRLGRALRLEVLEVREEPLQQGTVDEVQERERRRVEPHLEGWPLVCLDRGGRAPRLRGPRGVAARARGATAAAHGPPARRADRHRPGAPAARGGCASRWAR